MKKLLLFLIIPFLSFGQNLIYNGDFEEYTDLPDDRGQLMNCVGWNNVNLVPGHFFVGTIYASPDYYHLESDYYSGVGLPSALNAFVNPFSGSAIAAFSTYSGELPEGFPPEAADFMIDYREYISSELLSELTVGETYNLSFWLTNGEGEWCCVAGTNHIGIHFSESPLSQADHEPINIAPLLEIDGEVWETSWKNYNFTFTADQPYKFITIGNFYPDEDVSYTVEIDSPVPLHWGYYFIDKIELINSSMSSVNDNDNTHKSLLKTLDMLGRKTIDSKGFQLHIYDDGSVEKKYLIH